MAATLGSLFVDLRANAAQFESDMGRAARIAEKEGKRMAADLRRVSGELATIGAAAVTGFGLMLKHQLDAAGNLDDLSQKVGISASALSELEFAAGLSGANLELLASSLSRLSKAAVSARDGTGDAAGAFKALGVEVLDANGKLKGNETLLADLAEAFSQYEDGAAKSAAAQAIFGKSGAELIPFLNNGKAGIAELRAEASALGLTIRDDTARAAEELGDNLDKLRLAGKGVVNQVMAEMIPGLLDLSKASIEAATQSGALKAAGDGLATMFKTVALGGIVLKNTLDIMGKSLGGVAASIVLALKGDIAGAWAAYRATAKDTRSDVRDIVAGYEALFAPAAASANKAAVAGERARAALNFTGAARPVRVTAVDDKMMADAIKQFAQEQESLRRESEALTLSLRTLDEVYADQRDRIDDLYNRGLIDAETRTRALTKASKDLYDGLDALEKPIEETADALSVYMEEAARNTQRILADFLFDPFKDGLDGMVADFGEMIRRMLADAAAAQLAEALFGKDGNGGGWFDQAINWAMTAMASYGGGQAVGGPVAAGKTYMVGEQGPELFVPNSAGTVVPNGKIGGTNVVQIHLTTERGGRVSSQALTQVQAAAFRGLQQANARNN